VIKASLLGAVVGFIYVMSLTLMSPICTLCFTPLLGLGVGYLAGWFDNPLKRETSLLRGGAAGGITGIGVVVGQMLAAVVNGILVTNSNELPKLLRQLGLSELLITDSDEYWQATLTLSAFCGVFNLAIIVGLGALGALIWFQRHHEGTLSTAST
jgi:MFS family permease